MDGRRPSVGTQNLLMAAPFTHMAFWGYVPGNFSAPWAIKMACAWLVFPYAGVPTKAPVHSKRAPKIFGLSRHETSKPAAWIWRFKARQWEIFPTAANSLLNLFSLRPNTLTSAFHSLEMATQVLSVLQTGKTCSAESMPFPTSEREQPVLQDDSRLHRQDDRVYGHRPYINRLHQCTLDCYEQDAWF